MSNVKRHHVYNHAALFSITKAWPAEPFHTRVQVAPPEKPEHFTGMPKSMKARIKMQGNKQKAQHSGVPVKAVCRYENHEQFWHLTIRCCEVCERAPTLENGWHTHKKRPPSQWYLRPPSVTVHLIVPCCCEARENVQAATDDSPAKSRCRSATAQRATSVSKADRSTTIGLRSNTQIGRVDQHSYIGPLTIGFSPGATRNMLRNILLSSCAKQ